MTLKHQIHERFSQKLQSTIADYQQTLADLQLSMANETKSTAGDKYETALAMLQLEEQQTKQKLSVAQQQLVTLQLLANSPASKGIAPGSLVNTNHGIFYISIAAGKIEVENQIVIAISPSSPLGKQLMQKQAGDTIQLPPLVYQILQIS